MSDAKKTDKTFSRKQKQRYPALLTAKEICRLLRAGVYLVSLADGTVVGPKRNVVTPFFDDDGYSFVRLYSNGKRKAISVSKLVWMAKTLRPVPPGFEIHHRNGFCRDNAWENLLCVHELDHLKIHAGDSASYCEHFVAVGDWCPECNRERNVASCDPDNAHAPCF